MLQEGIERPITVEGVYDKQVLDIDASELLTEVNEYNDAIGESIDEYGEEEEHDRSGDDPYGGMPLELYDNIVEFKRSGIYPSNIGTQHDRSALSHWRARCMRFILADDNETLLYYNPSSSVNDQPKVVVKRGEVRRVIGRIHDLIGHLGQKRTQIVVLKKLHWRSVRQDVKTFINNCAFCNQKKLEGKKILKAPVDVTSDSFDLNVEVRTRSIGNNENFDRLNFSLIGYNEHEVRAAAVTRMTTYTFKETANEMRGRCARPTSMTKLASQVLHRGIYEADPHAPLRVCAECQLQGTVPTNFRRQPYIKRTRYSPYASGFIVPYTPKNKNDEPGFIEIFQDVQGSSLTSAYSDPLYPEEEHDSGQITESSIGQNSAGGSRPDTMPAKSIDNPSSIQATDESKRDLAITSTSRLRSVNGGRQKKLVNTSNMGLAARFNLAVNENIDRSELIADNSELLSSYETIQSRPELCALPPIMFMPSVDPDVVQMQKELLMRQLRLQRMQEKVLQAQLNSLRLPIARYEEIDPDGEQVQLMGEEEEVYMRDTVEEEQELNVVNSGDESGEEVLSSTNRQLITAKHRQTEVL